MKKHTPVPQSLSTTKVAPGTAGRAGIGDHDEERPQRHVCFVAINRENSINLRLREAQERWRTLGGGLAIVCERTLECVRHISDGWYGSRF